MHQMFLQRRLAVAKYLVLLVDDNAVKTVKNERDFVVVKLAAEFRNVLKYFSIDYLWLMHSCSTIWCHPRHGVFCPVTEERQRQCC